MCGGSPKAPAPAPMLPEAPVAPTQSTMGLASADKRRRASSTILTSTQGATDTVLTGVGTKTLLGQ
jgi:hypothetical protein